MKPMAVIAGLIETIGLMLCWLFSKIKLKGLKGNLQLRLISVCNVIGQGKLPVSGSHG
jgi:hypothetical protein